MELTRAEEKIMHILWKTEKGFIKDILDHYGNPKPAYTTVATVVKILQRKGFVTYKAYGNAHQFYPVISKSEYSKMHINVIFKKYFKSSIREVVSFFAENNKMHGDDIDEAIRLLGKIRKKKK
jgi:BlaI family transcriptional regulator, penicillinase repressor